MLALSDTVALLMSAIGLVVMSMATPGSLQGSLHKVRQSAIDPAELQAKADASRLSIDNWWMQQTSYVPTNVQVTGFYLHQVLQHGTIQTIWSTRDGSPLPEHPVKVGTPTPATMTMVTVYILATIVCLLVALAAMMSADEYNSECWYQE